jgi:hypothetical protein
VLGHPEVCPGSSGGGRGGSNGKAAAGSNGSGGAHGHAPEMDALVTAAGE